MKQTAARLVPALAALLLVCIHSFFIPRRAGQRQAAALAVARRAEHSGRVAAAAWQVAAAAVGSCLRATRPAATRTGDQAAGTAIIRGRVVAADSGTPVRRAQVRAQSGELRANRLVSTDAQGPFRVQGSSRRTLEPDRVEGGLHDAALRTEAPRSRPARPIEISDGQLMERADFALPRGAAITGRVFDEFGDPVANARAGAALPDGPGQRRLNLAGGGDQTDDTGAYRIYGLAPGDYYVSATLRAGNGPFLDDQEQRHDELRVHLLPGDRKRLRSAAPDARYRPGAAERELRAAAGSHGEDHRHGAQLHGHRAFKRNGHADGGRGRRWTRRWWSGILCFGGGNGRVRPDGSFSIANVSPGNYTLVAMAGPGGGRGGGGGFAVQIGPGGAGLPDIEMLTMPLTVGNEDVTGLTLVTSKGASLSGNVVAAEGSAAKLNTNQIQIIAQAATQALPGPLGNRPARVDADGTFVLTGLTGQKFIRVNGLPQEWTLKSVMLNGQT